VSAAKIAQSYRPAMPLKPLRPLAIVCALLATVAVAACSSPTTMANTAPQTVAPSTATPTTAMPVPSDPLPQQLWGTWQAQGSPTTIAVLSAHAFAFYPAPPKIGAAGASGPDQITFGPPMRATRQAPMCGRS
jgi:hypothetical protein